MEGKVKWFDSKRAYGFIHSESLNADVFVHVSGLVVNEEGLKVISKDDEVAFDVKRGPKGLVAVNVRPISE